MAVKYDEDEQPEVQLTSMMDCIFLMLIFFLVSSQLKKIEKELPIELPEANVARSVKATPDLVTVSVDSKGAIYTGRKEGMNPYKDDIATITNPSHEEGKLADVIRGADVFIGVSAAGCVTQDMVRSMANDPIVMGMANPTPEIMPDEAKAAGARVVCTGRSDFPNQVNNLLAFPGIFRGALDVRAKEINEEMKIAAAKAIAGLISESELDADHVIASPFDPRVAPSVASAVAKAALETGVARLTDVTPEDVAAHTRKLLEENRKAEATA